MSVSNEQKHYENHSLYNDGEVRIPLVYIKKSDEFGERYLGFIPGFLMKNVTATTLSECKVELKMYLKERLKSMLKNKVDIPFFPTEDEIRQDYDDVTLVEFLRVKK